jgi:hypothetical protein
MGQKFVLRSLRYFDKRSGLKTSRRVKQLLSKEKATLEWWLHIDSKFTFRLGNLQVICLY